MAHECDCKLLCERIHRDELLLRMLGELLVQLRGLSAFYTGEGGSCGVTPHNLSDKDAFKAIRDLSDAFHNLPEIIAYPASAGCLLEMTLRDIEVVGKDVFGEKSPFGDYVRQLGHPHSVLDLQSKINVD